MTSGSAAAPASVMEPAGGGRDLAVFTAARAVAVVGSAISGVALPVLVYGVSGSPFLTSLVAAGQVAPYLVLGLLAGAMADRWPRRRVMLAAQTVCALAMLSVPVADAFGEVGTAHALGVTWLAASAFVWFDAAAFGALPAIVGRDRIAAANHRIWTVTTLLGVGAPALGGAVVTLVGPSRALLLDAGAYVAAAVLLAMVTAPFGPDRAAGPRPRLRADVAEGLRFVWQQPTVRALTLLGVGNSVAGGAVTGLLVVLAADLGAGADGAAVGAMVTAVAVGGFCGSLLLPRLSRRLEPVPLAVAGLVAGAVLAGLLAAASSYVVALVLLTAWSTAHTGVVLNGISTRQQLTPDALQARVNTTARMVAWGGSPVGAVAAGVAAGAAGTSVAYAGAAGVLALTAVLGAALGLRSPEEVSAARR